MRSNGKGIVWDTISSEDCHVKFVYKGLLKCNRDLYYYLIIRLILYDMPPYGFIRNIESHIEVVKLFMHVIIYYRLLHRQARMFNMGN